MTPQEAAQEATSALLTEQKRAVEAQELIRRFEQFLSPLELRVARLTQERRIW